jgi:hypothetical protein
VGLTLLFAGSAWGEDDHFPFGPFKMYARATKPDGRVAITTMVAVDQAGRSRELLAEDVGLRRAELEGQVPRLRADPSLLAPLAPAGTIELRLVSRGQRLRDGRPIGPVTDRPLAVWRRQP